MKRFILIILSAWMLQPVFAEQVFSIETAIDNTNFIINGLPFAAKTYCQGFELGDQVIFLDGDPDGSSSDALILDARTNGACEVWSQSIN